MYTPPQYPRRGGAGARSGGFNPVPLQNPPIPFPGVPQYYQNPPVPQQQFQNPNFHWPQNPLVPQQQFQHPNFHWPQNPYNQSLALPHSNPLHNPLPSINPYTQSPTFYQSDPSPNPSSTLDRIESAVSKAQHDLSVSGESISAWKVSQSALIALKADSWSSLGFQLQNIPFLHRLLIIEGKVNAFIHCFVGAQRITSLYELEVAICKNEGVERFEEIGLGPLTHHPLVEHYFSFPSDSGEICKITSEEIIKFMCAFIHKCKPKVDIEEFLDFIAKKKSVSVKKKLGVRIQSLGLHISYIREAKKAEKNILSKHLGVIKTGGSGGREGRDPSQTSRLLLEKHILDGRFDHISDRMKSFSSTWDDFGGEGKHIRFTCSDDDDDDVEEEEEEKDPSFFQNQNSCHDKDSGRRVSNCPYPSTTEEIVRLGLKNETSVKTPLGYREILQSGDEKLSGKKRKLVEKKDKSSSSCKLLKREHAFHSEKEKYFPDYILTWRNMEKFITTWKEACRELPLAKVLNRMLNFYRNSNTQDKKIKMVFMTYPFIGLLNVAVTSIKSGMLDSMYDTILAFDEHEFISPESGGAAEMIEIEEPSVKDISDTNISNEVVHSVSVDDIIKQVVKYYDIDQLVSSGSNVSSGNQIAYLKMLCNCETRLIAQFSVKEFSSLGYGNFFKFLVKYASLLPLELQSFLSVNFNVRSRLEVSMLEQQLRVFLSQVKSSTTDDDSITKDYVSMLLKKQFPTFSFCIVGNEAEKCFDELIKSQKDIDVGCVLFSTALLGKQTAFSLTVSSKDAIECLLKAPMLADLLAWSHWDLLFAPSLGPLSDWLLNNGLYVKELLCIATVDGKLVRIDQSATADEFLEAMIQRSPFQVAVKLLSVVSLYKGLNSAPLSLLKCYAQRAFDIIIKNSVDSKVTLDEGINANPLSNETTGNGRALCKILSRINDAVSAISSFILECLHYLPLEFRSFAADILISGLGSFTKDAPSIILLECRQLDQRLVLHDVGLSLGITEWIEDYYEFSKASADLSMSSKAVTNDDHLHTEIGIELKDTPHVSEGSVSTNYIFDVHKRENNVAMEDRVSNKVSSEISEMIADREVEEALHTIESIRHEEFGLDPNINYTESCLLRKQHARLGRALHCLSQELYSQDSHLLLELVQNADDNIYPENIDPTLVFIVQDTGIVVLNNEKGFSAKNIRALCDVGNSTKKGSGAGYIGNKGIGFKSVFRVTDAPEIHSNGFHVKFDITEGQIGFVLPTVISPCDIGMFKRMLSGGNDKSDGASWKTCILLPFRSKFREGVGLNSIVSMFLDLHPSLLLFLHRLQCIMFKNMLNDNLVVMRRETLGDGIVRVTHGEEIMSWLVVSKKLQASIFRQDVETTEIAMAFTLEETGDGVYKSHLRQQPVFAFLPLRNYGLKFILQGDFVLPSSREEVDGDSAWNQWLLSEFPGLFVSAEQSFCSLPCFRENPGKAVTAYMNFVPLVGEVHGFFSHLPHMIISKLRTSSCLFLDGPELKWVLPCRGLRGWNEEARILLSDDLLQKHLGLCYLSKDVILSDPLAKALGVQDYGPKVLIEIISSICCANDGIKSLGLDWLSSWLAALYSILPVYSSGELEYDLINSLKNVPFVPLSDGSYSSMTDGPIWLPCDAFAIGFEGNRSPKEFQILYARLRIVNPLLFYGMNELKENSVLQMLRKIGVEQLSAHDVIKSHILVTLSADTNTMEDTDMMIEYLTFIMLHFQHDCASCCSDKAGIIAELRKKPILLTNHGYKCPLYETIHFGREYGNPVDIEKLIGIVDIKWVEVDIAYLKHPTTRSSSLEMTKLRTFFQDLGVTDFVQVTRVDKNAPDITVSGSLRDGKDSVLPSIISDWESTELVNLLSVVSIKKHREQCICLLEILDKMWDDCYSASARGYIMSRTSEDKKAFDSSFLNCIREFQWIASSMDKELHFSKDLFHDCEEVRSMLGTMVPYAVPKVTSKMLLKDIGFKIQVSFDDVLNMLHSWRVCKPPYKASIGQMAKLYTFIADEVSKSRIRSTEDFITSPFIFVPDSINSRQNVVSGVFVSPKEVYWTDPTGCVDRIQEMILMHTSLNKASCLQCNSLATVYPNLHDFFVNVCGVQHFPSFASYLQILLQLSTVTLPSEAAHLVFRVLLRWVDDIKSGLVKPEEVSKLKEELIKLENTVLPTLEDKWVSLHPSFGIVCWSDDEKLKQQFKHFDGVYFLQFGELNSDENKMLSGKVAKLLGVPALSEIVSREAIFYGTVDDKKKAALINWVLPYAQRYLHKLHPEIYLNLKQLGFEKLSHLQVVVVDKLFYKHTLKAHESTSKKRWECSCLLQGNIFYATQLSDPHSMFLELSRFFFNGSVELHLANFLHMVTTMAESGSSCEQTELFIINNQKVPMLPDEEPIWSFSSPLELSEHRTQLPSSSASSEQKESTKRKPGISANWPPRGWRTAPGFDYARANHYLTYGVSQEYSKAPETLSRTENITVPVEIDWTIEEEMLSTNTLVLQGSEMIDDKPHEPVRSNTVNRQIGLSTGPKIESFDSFIDTKRDMGVTNPLTSSERDWIYLQTPEENQATRRTGRLGEMVAYKYFSERLGPRNVKWVNESIETGLPYDLVIMDDKGGIREYIEVKSTKSASKDWFEISTREWQFATERGDSFSIAHVILVGERKAMVTVMRNPVKLCQQNGLQLAILMSRKLRENFGFDSVNTCAE